MVAPLDSVCATIPLIDISGYLNGDKEKAERAVVELRTACQSPGFLQITGHGVTSEIRSQLLQKLAEFFALPAATKQALHRSQSKCLRGYESVGEQKLEAGISDQKEGFMIGPDLPAENGYLQGPNQWPSEEAAPGFREVYMAYFDVMRNLSKTVFRLMALSLDLDERYFDEFVGSKDTISMCRAHRYPPTTPEMAKTSRGIGAHTDFGALTLLLQDDVGGLEVFHKPTGTWHNVQPVKDAFVVNIGDMMERWTNNTYTSTLHRVISPVTAKDRYSVAFFNEGLPDQLVSCIPTCLKPNEKPLFEPIRVEDHLRARYGNSY
ncbi:putative gibberellin 20 oxidase [Eremomyces bilateralis CBS 781.70]|uniref:Gibberellin 20 oxidase n=1 Tax=Eremomyces bilateralis CBS 781.70 TaxID=1392243 RepID=A0A6G1G696_9PEZI|nr:putative gibberellin 20 oxidase [Eremomyces bilateralis CBS 781.70]KAF1813558.1 putative gibberellin 20 oxidase [Eremomyces bilateralis CBS 781.70]